MTPLYLIAVIRPRADRLQEARAAFDSLIARTRQESGCELYDLVSSPSDSREWLMLEKWASREHWDAHMASEHVIAHNSRAGAFLEGPAELRFFDPA